MGNNVKPKRNIIFQMESKCLDSLLLSSHHAMHCFLQILTAQGRAFLYVVCTWISYHALCILGSHVQTPQVLANMPSSPWRERP